MAVGSSNLSGGSCNPAKIFANIFIAFIGAGVLGLPYAFKEAGILEGTVIMTFVSIVSIRAMLLMIDCKYRILSLRGGSFAQLKKVDILDDQDRPRNILLDNNDFSKHEENLMIKLKEPPRELTDDISYGDVGYHAIGRLGQVLVDFSIVISQTGFCCAYIIFMYENLSDTIRGIYFGHWLLVLLPPLFLLTLFRNLSSLALSSMLAQFANMMAFAVVFWFDLEHALEITFQPVEIRLGGFPFFFAIAIYCYEGAGMILSLEYSLAEDVRPKFKRYLTVTMIGVTMLYITFGACGYLSFGSDTMPIITLNLPSGDGFDFGVLVKLCLCLGVFFTYPVMLFPVTQILQSHFLPDAGKYMWKGNALRFCVVMVTAFVVLAVPNFANMMALVGATCCTTLALILPGVFHLNVFAGSLTQFQKCFDWFLICIGIFGMTVGTVDVLSRLSGAARSMDPGLIFDSGQIDPSENISVPIGISPATAVADNLTAFHYRNNATDIRLSRLRV